MPKAPKANVGANKRVIHPNSRQATYLARKAFHKQRVDQSRSSRTTKYDVFAEKLKWFYDNLDPSRNVYTKQDLILLTKKYLSRFQEELDQIEIINSIGSRKGNQHCARAAAIHLTMEKEKRELCGGGLEVPDLVNKTNLDVFKAWTCEVRFMQNFKLKRILQSDVDKLSASETVASEGQTSELRKEESSSDSEDAA